MMRGLLHRLRELAHRRRLARDLDDEMALHVQLLAERHVRAGMSIDAARRRAAIELGSPALAREQVGDERTGATIASLVRDAARACRSLRRAPGLSALSISTMAVGIGAVTLLFALVNGIVLSPLPYPEPERLVRIFDVNEAAGVARAGAASGNIDDWRARSSAFRGIAGYYAMGRTIGRGAGAEAEVLVAAQVTADFFEVMSVLPHLGRTFTDDEIQGGDFDNAAMPVGADPVAVLSHRVWLQRFGADPAVVGRSTTIDRRSFRIVGVMPPGFAMPDDGVDLWLPWDVAGNRPRDQHYLGAVARLAPGVTIEQATAGLRAVARALGDEHPASNRGWSIALSPLEAETVGTTAAILWLLFGAVVLVLVVACANVALVALARGLDRRDETAVRLALGATPGRVMREFLLESAVLSLAGGAAGLLLAGLGLAALPRLAPDLPRLSDVAIDLRVAAFAAAATALAALLAGLPQAIRASRVSPAHGLGAGARATADRGRHALRDALVIAEVALAVVLVAGSGLLIRSVLQLRATDPGFDPRGVLVAPIFLDTQAYDAGATVRAYYADLFDRLSTLPGVTAVGGATTVPTSPLGPDFDRPVWPDGSTNDPSRRVPAAVRMVTPGYFPALRLRVIDGRAIDDRDRPETPRVVMVNETLARTLWADGRVVGERLVVDYSTAGTYPYDVVGVVGDVRFAGPRSAPKPEIYLPHAQRSYLILNVVVRTAGDARALVPAVRATLRDLDPDKPAHALTPLEELVGATYARDRQAMIALVVFGATAAALAVISVYGVLAQRVRERAREIGIRMAMGAGATRVVGWVTSAGLRLVATGLAIGLLLAWLSAGALEGLLFGVRPVDGPTFGLVLVAVLAVGLIASVVPAWRAARIDPVTVLRRG
jgi:predicted permease